MRSYPVRTAFYKISKTSNGYGEVISTANLFFVTGSSPGTVSFKDRLQTDVEVSGDQQYVFVRKSPQTLAVSVGDRLEMPSLSDATFEIKAIDPKYSNLRELMFLVDRLEA